MFDRRIRVQFLNLLSESGIVVEHKEYPRSMKNRIFLHDFESVNFMVGEEVDRVSEDGQVGKIVVAFFVNEHVLVCFFRQGDEVAGHIGIAFVERGGSRLIVGEENKIFCEIENSASQEGDDKERKEGDTGSGLRADGLADYPKSRESGHEKNRRLCADGAERVWQPFIGEEFGHKHNEK